MDLSQVGNLSSQQKDQLMSEVKQQIAVANAQELLTVSTTTNDLRRVTFHQNNQFNISFLLQKMTEKCFKKCVAKPGTSLGNSEQKCIAMCMDRFMDSWNLISRTYVKRIQQEQGGAGF